MITKLSCHGYRGFATDQTLELAIPNGKSGSGLTVLVGPNGGGKSTLVESFSKFSAYEASFTEGKRNIKSDDRVSIKISFYESEIKNIVEGELKTVESGGSETEWSHGIAKPKVYYLPSRRVFNPYFSKNPWTRENYLSNPEVTQFRGNPLSHFTYRLFDVYKKLEGFNKIFWNILGKKLEWTIDQDDSGNYYVKVKKDEHTYHNSDGLGEGIVSLLFIVDAIFESNENELIVIDEPELSLHPQLQNRLLNKLLEVTKTQQVVISTHSPNMVSIESAINGGVIARIYENEHGSVINSIDNTCRGYFKSYSKNINNPHVIGNDARSCFFAEDGYIITEGQEDVMLYPSILEQLGLEYYIPFFGFGAGGAENISKIAYIFRCLGFTNIGAIYDGDKNDEYEKFRSEYGEYGYKAWIIPADDIRDKDAVNKEAKEGLLDNNKVIKEEFKEELMTLFTEVSDFSLNHR